MCTQLPHIATLEICMFYDNDNNDDMIMMMMMMVSLDQKSLEKL